MDVLLNVKAGGSSLADDILILLKEDSTREKASLCSQQYASDSFPNFPQFQNNIMYLL